jgi:hypothetical protein
MAPPDRAERASPVSRVGALLLAVAAALDVWATASLARAMGPANDLFPRWFGTRAWLLEGLNPYAPAVDAGIRAAMGAAPGEALGAFVFGFVYPGYVALLLAPLALLPFEVAAAIWLLLAQVATGGGAWLAWRAAGRETPAAPARATPALLVAFLFPASLFNLAFGQFAALVFAALAGAWYLIPRGAAGAGTRRAVLAGALLAVAAVKPSLALLPAAALLLWCVGHGRRAVLGGAALTFGLLVGSSLLLLPGWPADFWRSTLEYARVASATSAAGLVAGLLGRLTGAPESAQPAPGPAVAVAVLAAAVAGAGWAASPRRAGDALAGGVLLGAWLVPPLYEWNSILLLLPLVGWLRSLAGGRALLPATAAVLLAGAATVPLLLRWPNETRALWPALVLGGWTATALVRRVGRYRGTKTATLRAGSSPSSAALT